MTHHHPELLAQDDPRGDRRDGRIEEENGHGIREREKTDGQIVRPHRGRHEEARQAEQKHVLALAEGSGHVPEPSHQPAQSEADAAASHIRQAQKR